MLVDADDPALGRIGCTIRMRWRSSSASSLAAAGETAGLDLDQLAVRAHEVDHVAVDLDLERVAGRGQQRFEVAVERAFTRRTPIPAV